MAFSSFRKGRGWEQPAKEKGTVLGRRLEEAVGGGLLSNPTEITQP
jgi:hypothetical protein